MTKLRKRVLVAVGIAFGVLVLMVLGVAFYADSLAATAIRSGASRALGVDTSVADVDIGWTSGEITVTGVEVDNPEGFDSPFFLQVASATTDVEVGSLLGDPIRVRTLGLSGIELRLDQLAAKSNYDVILDNLKRNEQAAESAEPESAESETTLTIDNLWLRDSRVVARIKLLPTATQWREVVVPIERIELDDVSTGEDGGISLEQLTGVIVKLVIATALENAGGELPDEVVRGLEAALDPLQSLKDIGFQAASALEKRAQEAAEGVLQRAKQALEGDRKGKQDE